MHAISTMNTEAPTETSDAILDEFFGGGGQFQQVRTKAMRRPGRRPVKQTAQLLQSLQSTSLTQEGQGQSPGGEGAVSNSSTPTRKRAQGIKKQTSKNKLETRPPRPVKTEKDVKDLHLEDRNVVSDLIHRVTQLSGLEPGAARVTFTPPNMLDKAAAMSDLQFKEFMNPSEHFQNTIATIVDIHKDIGELAQNLFYFRQSLGRDLKHLNDAFIKHFQLLISEILTMHRNKFKSQTETVNKLLHRLEVLEKQSEDNKERMEVLQTSKDALEADNERLSALSDNKDVTIKILQDEISALEKAQAEFMDMMERQRIQDELERQRRREEDKLMLMQERKLLLQQRQDLQAELMRQNALLQESAILKGTKAHMKKKQEQADFRAINKKCDSSSQTEYDDFGAWDRQSGWTLPISGTAKARNRWRRSLLYGSCPSCRGVGKFMSAAATQYKFFLRGEVITDDKYDLKKWRIPDQIIRFMSNIPRAIQAEKLHDTKWVLRHAWNFFDFKVKTDADDLRLGQPLQSFADFIIDTLLQRCERRVDAEMYLFIFLKSLQNCLSKKKNPLLHSFARFLGVFGTTDDEEQSEVVVTVTKAPMPISMTNVDSSCGHAGNDKSNIMGSPCIDEDEDNINVHKQVSIHDKDEHEIYKQASTHDKDEHKIYKQASTHDKDEHKILKQASTHDKDTIKIHKKTSTERNNANKGSKDITHMKVPNTNLTRGILDVYLFSRSEMLKPYNGIYAKGIAEAKSASDAGITSNLNKNQSKLEGSAEDQARDWGIIIPPHICVSDNFTSWVPLDRALDVSVAVLGFLSERQMLALNRQIEHEAMFLTKAGMLEEPEGSHSVIRASVRKILKSIGHVKGRAGDEGGAEQEEITIVVNLEKVLQATVHQLSTKIAIVETRLKRLFASGDDNGDGELSFREFKAIVSKVAPHFSNRTQLKMFREALMSGNDNSVITEHSFVMVCRKYGLVQLVDVGRLPQSNETISNFQNGNLPVHCKSVIPKNITTKEVLKEVEVPLKQCQSEELPPSLQDAMRMMGMESNIRKISSHDSLQPATAIAAKHIKQPLTTHQENDKQPSNSNYLYKHMLAVNIMSPDQKSQQSCGNGAAGTNDCGDGSQLQGHQYSPWSQGYSFQLDDSDSDDAEG